jgi:ubiquinone/menaquinone biosynthesis C-methylase UbiE
MNVKRLKVDVHWDDRDVVPDVICPDTAHVFNRMTQATIDVVDAKCGMLVLDVGCGIGADAGEIAKSGAAVIGLDPSKLMLSRAGNVRSVMFIQGAGEHLPFKTSLFDRIFCKGALDHFINPLVTLKEISRLLKPDGHLIVSIANYDSLSCKLGKALHKVLKLFGCRYNRARMMWQIPPDHVYKFDYNFLKALLNEVMHVEKMFGVSLLWGLPYWGLLLSKLPHRLSWSALEVLDKLASRLFVLSDVIVVRCCKSG